MLRKSLTTLVTVLILTSVARASAYPQKTGVINDYAGRLDQAQINELTSLIRDYERQTSIEIAVVVVDSLDSQSAREYAEGIGNGWGVGKAGRNNGIVLLWAPMERAYSLRVADGLSADLTDTDAREITQAKLVPYFKRGEYFSGIKETLLATMQKLGRSTWDERMKMRSEAAQARRVDRVSAGLIAALAGTIAGLGVVAGILLYRSRQRKEKLEEMAETENLIAENLRAAENNAPQIQKLLAELRKEMPEQDPGSLAKDFDTQRSRIAAITNDAARLNFHDVNSYSEMIRIKDAAAREAGFLSVTSERLADIRRAKEQSRALMEQLSRQKFEIADLRDSSRREEVDGLLSNSRMMYDRARQNSSMSMFDWILINDILVSSQDHIRQAEQVSRADPYIPMTPSFDTGSSYSSSVGTAGDFGGGGGFSGGSGSDGTY